LRLLSTLFFFLSFLHSRPNPQSEEMSVFVPSLSPSFPAPCAGLKDGIRSFSPLCFPSFSSLFLLRLLSVTGHEMSSAPKCSRTTEHIPAIERATPFFFAPSPSSLSSRFSSGPIFCSFFFPLSSWAPSFSRLRFRQTLVP